MKSAAEGVADAVGGLPWRPLVTVARRLGALETSLTPTQRILVWLDEAHAFGDLGAYVDSLVDQPPEAFPINRLARDVSTAART